MKFNLYIFFMLFLINISVALSNEDDHDSSSKEPLVACNSSVTDSSSNVKLQLVEHLTPHGFNKIISFDNDVLKELRTLLLDHLPIEPDLRFLQILQIFGDSNLSDYVKFDIVKPINYVYGLMNDMNNQGMITKTENDSEVYLLPKLVDTFVLSIETLNEFYENLANAKTEISTILDLGVFEFNQKKEIRALAKTFMPAGTKGRRDNFKKYFGVEKSIYLDFSSSKVNFTSNFVTFLDQHGLLNAKDENGYLFLQYLDYYPDNYPLEGFQIVPN